MSKFLLVLVAGILNCDKYQGYQVSSFYHNYQVANLILFLLASNGKERKDPESSRELLKRIPKRSTRQSTDNSSRTSSPSDIPPPKRRRIL